MFKIEFDKKITSNIINIYFFIVLWFALLVVTVQTSKELFLIAYLIKTKFIMD